MKISLFFLIFVIVIFIGVTGIYLYNQHLDAKLITEYETALANLSENQNDELAQCQASIETLFIPQMEMCREELRIKNQKLDASNGLVDAMFSDQNRRENRRIFKQYTLEGDSSSIPFSFSINSNDYTEAISKNRGIHGFSYVTPSAVELLDFFESMDHILISELNKELGTEYSHITPELIRTDKMVMAGAIGILTEIMRSMAYVTDAKIGFDDYPKYPVETIVESNGDCEDMSYLVATILSHYGFDVVLLRFSDHIAVGLSCPVEECVGTHYKYDGKKYYFIEATNFRDDGDVGKAWGKYTTESPQLLLPD